MNSKIKKSFLICHRGALGDFILTWPSILLLRRNFPEHKFVGLGRPDYMKLAVKLGIVDGWHDAESARMLDFFENGIIPEELGKPEKGVLWLKDAKKTADLLRKNSSCNFAPLDPFPSEKIHVAEFHLRGILNYFQINTQSGSLNLPTEGGHSCPPRRGLENPRSFQEEELLTLYNFDLISSFPHFPFPKNNIILIHPGSGSPKKNYSTEFYLETAKFAEDHFKIPVKFILGPVEMEKGLAKYFPDTRTLTPEHSSALADILGGAFLFIGNDSGVGHLAGFLGVPCIILYKDTDPEMWGAVGRKVSYLKGSGTDPENALTKLKLELQRADIFCARRSQATIRRV